MRLGLLLGTGLAFAAWYLMYRAAKPAIAHSVGSYVKAHAAEQIPDELAPIAQILGAQTADVANLLGNAVERAFLENL